MKSSLLTEPVERFLAQVAAREPAPGGGAAAAVTAALAAGLTAMAARFSDSRLADSAALATRADVLRERVAALADADAAAYQAVLAAYAEPKDADPPGRRMRIRAALHQACEVPLEIAEIAAEVAEMAARLALLGNPNLRGDAVTAALLAQAATRSSACLVRLNVDLGKLDDVLVDRACRHVRVASEAARRVTATECGA